MKNGLCYFWGGEGACDHNCKKSVESDGEVALRYENGSSPSLKTGRRRGLQPHL